MTGFATRLGHGAGQAWQWDIRSVNGKGLDLRLRLPDGIEGLEADLRAALGRAVTRGNVSLSLKLDRDPAAAGAIRLNPAALADVLRALAEVEQAAMAQGVTLRQASQAEILAIRGVLDTGAQADADTTPLRAALLADLAPLLADFDAARQAEGTALSSIVTAQVDRIAALVAEARAAAADRAAAAEATLRTQVARVLAEGVDAARLAQELALLAVKADITEELDRLEAHVAAARALLADPAPVGRKFEFLTQEFLREANTLCSKAGNTALTRVGLDLKTVIDQLREQAANVE
jgi:uncharacterized protein (TIGR00255 family)